MEANPTQGSVGHDQGHFIRRLLLEFGIYAASLGAENCLNSRGSSSFAKAMADRSSYGCQEAGLQREIHAPRRQMKST
jgi:hypothetical protein